MVPVGGRTSRRSLLRSLACGFGSIALNGLLSGQAAAARTGAGTARPHHTPRARRVIFLFMQGGPSHVDLFDYKPRLERDHGKALEFRVARTRKVTPERVMKSPWSFARH